MMRVVGNSWRMARVASIPPMRGIRTSIRTTSGASSSTRATASWPSAASATIWMSSSASRTIFRPRRNSSWSSETTTRMGSGRMGSGRMGSGRMGSGRSPPPPTPGMVTCRPLAGVDQPDVAVVAAVDDRGHAGVGVGEEVEVVPQHVHLQGRLLRRHRLDVELLGLDDPCRPLLPGTGVLLVGLVRVYVRGVATGMGPAQQPRLQLLDLVLELVDHAVQGREGVGRRRLGPADPPVAPQR